MKAIYRRELKSYFQSMTGYVFIAFLMLFTGIYFTAYNLNAGYPYFAYVLSSTLFIFLIVIPVLTMRSFAEERKSKTDQLLLTAPVSVTGIVLGKFLAMITVFLIPVLLSCVYPLIIHFQGTSYLKVDYSAIFIYFVIGCVYIAIGMFLSSLTESQIIAAVSTFATLLLFNMWSGVIGFLPDGKVGSWLKEILEKLNFTTLLTDLIENNLLDVSGVVLCISMVFVFVFLTIQTIQKRRWS